MSTCSSVCQTPPWEMSTSSTAQGTPPRPVRPPPPQDFSLHKLQKFFSDTPDTSGLVRSAAELHPRVPSNHVPQRREDEELHMLYQQWIAAVLDRAPQLRNAFGLFAHAHDVIARPLGDRHLVGHPFGAPFAAHPILEERKFLGFLECAVLQSAIPFAAHPVLLEGRNYVVLQSAVVPFAAHPVGRNWCRPTNHDLGDNKKTLVTSSPKPKTVVRRNTDTGTLFRTPYPRRRRSISRQHAPTRLRHLCPIPKPRTPQTQTSTEMGVAGLESFPRELFRLAHTQSWRGEIGAHPPPPVLTGDNKKTVVASSPKPKAVVNSATGPKYWLQAVLGAYFLGFKSYRSGGGESVDGALVVFGNTGRVALKMSGDELHDSVEDVIPFMEEYVHVFRDQSLAPASEKVARALISSTAATSCLPDRLCVGDVARNHDHPDGHVLGGCPEVALHHQRHCPQ